MTTALFDTTPYDIAIDDTAGDQISLRITIPAVLAASAGGWYLIYQAGRAVLALLA